MAAILVVDDEPALRTLMSRFLTAQGHEVRCAEDGRAGCAMLAERPADLLITDIFMPNADGFEFLLEIRTRQIDIPILAISGGGSLNFQGILHMARKLGADRVLSKPVDLQCLGEVVRDLLKSRSGPRPAGPTTQRSGWTHTGSREGG